MKKIVFIIMLLLMAATLSSCTTRTREISENGITVTLPTNFKKSKADNTQVYYVSRNAMFMGNKFPKTDYPSTIQYSEGDHQAFADHLRNDNLLEYDGKPADYSYLEESNDGSNFAYLYYDNTVNNVEYTYMLVVKVAENNFFVMNFACLKTDFEKYKNDFMEYAKSIKVEE